VSLIKKQNTYPEVKGLLSPWLLGATISRQKPENEENNL